ncbi:IS5 family transposase [Paraburkholderia sp. GAS448]
MTRECHVRFCERLGGRLPRSTYHFGMKAHVGVDADSGLVHSVVGTAANVSDVSQAHALLHGHEEEAFGDAGYIGVDKRDEMKGKPVKWRVAAKRGKIKAMQEGPLKDLVIAVERTKAQIRARVEHPFHVVKNLFRHRKVRYKGLAKNTAQLFSLFALANLVIAKNQLLSTHGSSPSWGDLDFCAISRFERCRLDAPLRTGDSVRLRAEIGHF